MVTFLGRPAHSSKLWGCNTIINKYSMWSKGTGHLVQLRGEVSARLNETIQDSGGDSMDINTSSLLKA